LPKLSGTFGEDGLNIGIERRLNNQERGFDENWLVADDSPMIGFETPELARVIPMIGVVVNR
jgi:hypothetical protein